MDWQPMSTAPKPSSWLRDPPGQLYVIACFHQRTDEDGEPEGEPELSWAQVADLSFDGFYVATSGFAAIHGHARFRLHEKAGTHWAILPTLAAISRAEAPPIAGGGE